VIALVAATALLASGSQLPSLPPIKREAQVTYLDRSGAVLGVRGGRYGPPVDLAKLPAYVPAAFVAIEDRRFYEHTGFDPVGIARAIVTDLSAGRAREGASTITQQLARNLYLNADQTVERKAREIFYAVQLEQTYSKKQILGLYLSRVYFGGGAYGLEAAAQRYFNKPAARLTIREGDPGRRPEVAHQLQSRRQSRGRGAAFEAGAGRHGGDRRDQQRRPRQGARPDHQGLQDRVDRFGAVLHRLAGRPDPPDRRRAEAGPGGRDDPGPADGDRRRGHVAPRRHRPREPGG